MTCRICRTEDTEVVLDLGNQVITSRFPVCGDFSTPTTPICLIQCKTCGLVQLKDLVSGSEMYEHMYGYRSGLNESMRAHLRAYNTEARGKVTLADGDAVLDIGSNDATFLGCYPNRLRPDRQSVCIVLHGHGASAHLLYKGRGNWDVQTCIVYIHVLRPPRSCSVCS
jgi:hypothetical protein